MRGDRTYDGYLNIFIKTYIEDRLGSLLHYLKNLSEEEEHHRERFMKIRIPVDSDPPKEIKEEIRWAEKILEDHGIDPKKKDFPRTQRWLHG